MDAATGVGYVVGLLLLLVVARLVLTPLRLAMRLAVSGMVGLLLLWLVNLLGSYVNVHVGVNPVTALVAGFLGIPGLVLLVAARYMIAG